MRKNKVHLYLVLIFGLALLIGVGYALLTSNLNIFGQTTIQKASWDVHFENLSVKEGSVTATTPASIDANGTTVNYTVSLNMPGDYYEFTVEEVNKGTIDAMVSSIVKTGITEEQAKYINYSVTYSDGTIVSEKQQLASGGKETIKVKVEFKRDITAQDLPTTSQTLNLSFSLNYIQADSSAVAVGHPVCRRATILHSDGTNTYGSLGTSGTLTSGDAFDCDVNGDGVYDSEKERFYYVTDLDTNNDYAVFIYYNNVAGGVPNNVDKYKYNTTSISGDGNITGPTSLRQQLPTISQWKNVNLANDRRDILDNDGVLILQSFSYSGYAARLLTTQELASVTGIASSSIAYKDLSLYNYFFENSSYWLETTERYYSDDAHNLYLSTEDKKIYGTCSGIYCTPMYGVRPVIEVEKVNMSY